MFTGTVDFFLELTKGTGKFVRDIEKVSSRKRKLKIFWRFGDGWVHLFTVQVLLHVTPILLYVTRNGFHATPSKQSVTTNLRVSQMFDWLREILSRPC